MTTASKATLIIVADPDPAQRSKVVKAVDSAAAKANLKVTVEEAPDGTIALAKCGDHRPVLLITEILLEGISGLALLRRLQSQGAHTKVIFVTNMARETDRYWGLRGGAIAYLTKPFDEATLGDRVHRVLTAGPDVKADSPE